MSHRLLINPGTPQAWEIQLKPGTNRIGRGEHNDFMVPHVSISGSHCEVVVNGDGSVILRDLASTNGTFINRAPIKESVLQPGQHLQLGAVDMIFESGTPAVATTPAAPAPLAVRLTAVPSSAPAAPPPVAVRMTGAHGAAMSSAPPPAAPAAPPLPPQAAAKPAMRFSGAPQAAAPAAALPAVAVQEAPEESPPLPTIPLSAGAAFCKFHPKSRARFYCAQCRKYYCDMCVTTRSSSTGQKKTCRACGQDVAPVQVSSAAFASRGFYGSIPGAFVFPFRGMGIVVLICATVAFGALNFVGWILVKIALYGLVFLFMQNIIHTTTSNENEPLSFPDADNLFGAAFQLGATIIASFGLFIGLFIAKLFEVEIPTAALIGSAILGCLYFPMAFLAVAMKDSVMAANPLVVFPTIFKMPLEYLVTCVFLLAVFAIKAVGDFLSGAAGMISLSTRDMKMFFGAMALQAALALINMYLLCVTMRVLGLLYNTRKQKFGWFSH